jgi:hypothetical protein
VLLDPDTLVLLDAELLTESELLGEKLALFEVEMDGEALVLSDTELESLVLSDFDTLTESDRLALVDRLGDRLVEIDPLILALTEPDGSAQMGDVTSPTLIHL